MGNRPHSRVYVCLPTYNELENLEPMVQALSEVLDTKVDRVLVIDDASPDGTGLLATELAGRLGWVEVLHRERKEGLGPAYIAGFRHALSRGAELVIEMDCDFSHDPTSVPRLIAACEAGADLALGSRYVEGGSVADWGAVRRLVSRAGSAYARMILGVPVRDLTGGFKCFRRRVLETIDLDSIGSKGYSFQIEGTYRVICAGFDVVEVPIRFSDRRIGSSKMTTAIVIEAMLQVPALRWNARRGASARRVRHKQSEADTAPGGLRDDRVAPRSGGNP
jgi:dolichol-phosphate mannosyltransferase